MSKVRMKCAHCGKHFKSSSAKQTLCPDCEARERKQRVAARASGAVPAHIAPSAQVAAPKIVGPAAGILIPGLATAPAEPVHDQPKPQPAHAGESPRGEGTSPRAARADGAAKGVKSQASALATPKSPRPPNPSTPPFSITDEIRVAVESRYLELAQPVEFDGIRTQIANEMNIPKVAVKCVIRELRDRMHLPSWWELRAYTGSEEELERIRAAYVPLLPIPEVGVHKRLADELGLSPMVVYQGIRRLRAEMRLPQYNSPELHGTVSQPNSTESAPI